MVGMRKEEGQKMMPITNIPKNSKGPFILRMNLFLQTFKEITTKQWIIEENSLFFRNSRDNDSFPNMV
jgi:hypothetical protein